MPETIEQTQAVETPAFKRRYIAAGLLGRMVSSQLRKQSETGHPKNILKVADRVASRMNQSESLSKEVKAKIGEIFKTTSMWHGTGRYQYREGQVTDVLDYIAKNGKLQPQYDALDFTGPMESLSLAKSRMYARSYADMHGKGAAEPERHGSSMFWAWTFLGDIGIETALEGRVWTKEGRQTTREHFSQGGSADWYKKVSKSFMGTMELFRRGSDIEGNYPILFGVREGSFEPAETSRSVGIHELRSQQPLSLDQDITHIEVPRDKVDSTIELLSQYGRNVPVIPIEDCERYVSTLPFTQLVSGNVLS